MSQLFGSIDNDVVDFFIKDSEELCDFSDDFLKVSPNLLCHAELYSLFSDLTEEAADCFIIAEASGNREYIVSDGTNGCIGNLRGKISALTLAKSKILLTILYCHLDCPSFGIQLPGFKDIKSGIGCEQTVPLTVLASLYKEDSDRYSLKYGIGDNIVSFELAAVFYQSFLLGLLCKGGGTDFSIFSLESGLALSFVGFADLDHSEPVAPHMPGFYKTDDIGTGKPAVGQNIFESDLVFDCPADHLFGKFNLGHPVFTLPLSVNIGITFKFFASLAFLVAESVVAILSRFPHNGEVKHKLGPAIGNSHQKTFEPEHTFVFKMGEDPADIFNASACLVEVGVIYYEACILTLRVGTHLDLVPQLRGYAPQGLAPCHARVGDEAIEHILLGINKSFYRRIPAVEDIFHTKIREQQQALEHRQRAVKCVTLVLESKRALFCHTYAGKYAGDGLHCLGEFFIVEKLFDFRYKWCNFVYRHGLSIFSVWLLKITHFLSFRQETMSFFYAPIYLSFNLRNLNQ